jgi:hypothetical protein
MKWVRQVFVYLFSIILLASLVGMALAISAQISLAHPNKIEGWLSQSNLYASLTSSLTNQAENAIANNVTGGVSISKTVVQKAAQSALPQSLLKQSAQAFVSSNYAWLEGKTSEPNFKIDLSDAKQQFATQVANNSVLAHLTGLPTCTAAQTLQLESANPLLLSCLPAGVSPQFEASRVSQQLVNSSSFLSNPIITASTVSTKGLNGSEPYYKKLAKLPKYYQLAQKLPWALGILSILSLLIIIFCSRSKRIGVRRLSIVLMISGVLLVADKFATDVAFNKLKGRLFTHTDNHQVQQSLLAFAHYVEAEIAKIDLLIGIAYIILAIILFCILILTRHRRPKLNKEATTASLANNPNKPLGFRPTNSANPARTIQTPSAVHQNLKKRSKRRPPRLVQ